MNEVKSSLVSEAHNVSAQQPTPQLGRVSDQTPWLTSNEAAAYLRIEARTLLVWARQGKVKGYTLSGIKRHVWRFRAIDLDAMLLMPSVALDNRRIA